MAGRPREFDRTLVLVRAMRLFWQKGYEATSLSDLTAELKIGRQSLYLAFGDKDGLYQECLDHYTDLLESNLSVYLDQTGSALGNLHRYLDAAEAHSLGTEFYGCLLGNALSEVGTKDVKLQRMLARKVERIRLVYERTLTRAERQGELKPGTNVASLARAILTFTQGAALMCRVLHEPSAVRETLDGARALLAHASSGSANS